MEEVNFDDGAQKRKVQVRRDKDKFVVTIDGEPYTVQAELLSPGELQITMGTKVYKCVVAQEGNRRFVFLDGKVYELTKIEQTAYTAQDLEFQSESTSSREEQEGDVVSPMPGRIVKILVEEGELVEMGQDLIVVEAMKMENRIGAPYAGRVTRIHFQEGDQVSHGTPLVDLEPIQMDLEVEEVQN
ncbi:MAG: biotin/lipoyl-containing protein [Candidatus Heimdallarchaeota archaeon]